MTPPAQRTDRLALGPATRLAAIAATERAPIPADRAGAWDGVPRNETASGMTALRTSRLLLRRPQPSDWPAFRDFMLSDRAAMFASHGHEGRAFRSFAADLGHWEMFGFGLWAVTWAGDEGRAIALVGPWSPPDWPEREVGWKVLDAAAEGQGVAFEAARAALAHVWEVLGWDTAVSYVAHGNARSVRLAERLGARPDPGARPPEALGEAILVYRHPRPGATP